MAKKQKTKTYRCITVIEHGGKRYNRNSAIELEADEAAPLLEIEAIDENLDKIVVEEPEE